MVKRFVLFALLLLVAVLLYLLLWPVPISPAVWNPPAAPPLSGDYEKNSRLANVQRLSLGDGFAPEDIAIDSENRIYAGLDDGRIIRLQADGTRPELFANTQGRPLGMKFNAGGDLILADAIKGLLSISQDGSITVLSKQAGGEAILCANDLDIAADGTIYFTDASSKFPLTNYKADILEHQPNGRLLTYNPRTKETHVVLHQLCFANGVAVSPDQTFVLVAETGSYRILRVWLNQSTLNHSGDSPSDRKFGTPEIFIDNLPGFPDGISSNGKDKFWLALVTPRDATLDKLLPHPFLRKIVYRLPPFLQPAPKRYSFVLGLDSNGRVAENLQDGSPHCYAQIANAVEHQGSLYFGSIGESTVGRFILKE